MVVPFITAYRLAVFCKCAVSGPRYPLLAPPLAAIFLNRTLKTISRSRRTNEQTRVPCKCVNAPSPGLFDKCEFITRQCLSADRYWHSLSLSDMLRCESRARSPRYTIDLFRKVASLHTFESPDGCFWSFASRWFSGKYTKEFPLKSFTVWGNGAAVKVFGSWKNTWG